MSDNTWYYCAAEECALIGRQFIISGKNMSWFPFPVRDRQLMKEWRKALNYPVTWQPLDNQCICDKHFVFSDYDKDPTAICKKLKPSAVPHIFNLELRKFRRARKRDVHMIPAEQYEQLASKYDLKDAVIRLQRIDKSLNIPLGKTSYIKLNSPYTDDDRWLQHYKRSKAGQKNGKPVPVKRRRIRKSAAKIREDFDENMDLSPEFMESLLTPETNLVEQELTNVSIWAGKDDVSPQRSLFVVRDQLPPKLRAISADHLWIQDPTCQDRRLKVQVVDASYKTTWMPDAQQTEPVSSTNLQSGIYPIAIGASQHQTIYNKVEEVESMVISDSSPSTSHETYRTTSVLSSLLKKQFVGAGPVQPPAFDACSYGINHDHQYLCATDPLQLPESTSPALEPSALAPEPATLSPEPILLTPVSAPSKSVALPGFHLMPASKFEVQKLFTVPTQPQAVYQPQSRSLIVSVRKPERIENAELTSARNRIMSLENELTDTRRQLSAARLLINRLRLGELAKSAQIRALQQAEKASNLPLYNQVFESSTFENFGQHFMAEQNS